jgi:hypothetical protein
MANPSTVPASAAGTEILRRAYINNLTGTSGSALIDGVANYNYTVLSVVFCEVNASTDDKISMWVEYDGGATYLNLIKNQPLGANQTFVWNDKIFLSETDELFVSTATVAIDVYCTYIEQRWA